MKRRKHTSPARPRAKSRGKPASTPPVQQGSGHRLLRFFLLFSAVGCLGIGALFLHVDRRVRERIAQPLHQRSAAIWSDVLKIAAHQIPSREALESELLSRSYTKVLHHPAAPGEYSISEDSLYVFRRAIGLSPREEIAPELVRIRFPPAPALLDAHGNERLSFLLEPVPFAFLTQSEVNVSRYIPLEGIPKRLQQAVIATEDERFYSHAGVDFIGIARALVTNVRAGGIVQGGSTITQQLAKNLLLSPRRTLQRKVLEVLAAISLELHLSKDRILELYLNEVYLGQDGVVAIHGMGEASRSFFGKSVQDLTIAESALLAGLIQAPSAYAPRRNYDRALRRSSIVLGRMADSGVISDAELKRSLQERPRIHEAPSYTKTAPHYVAALHQTLASEFGFDATSAPGLQVRTGIDTRFQRCAETSVERGLSSIEKRYPRFKKSDPPLEAALLAIEADTGKIRAWVGGRDYSKSQFNHVSQARRQIGSTIKPFLYLTALDGTLNAYKVATTTSVLEDTPQQIELVTKDVWEPQNFDKEFRGDVTLRYALEHSLNLPAIYVANRVGIPALARTVRRFRLANDVPEVPALALGALDTSLLELTAAFAALANGGRYVTPRIIESVITADETLRSPSIEDNLADPAAVYVLTDVMRGVIERGTGRAARSAGFSLPAAGKTGTSNEARDAWFVGFTPRLSVGVWVGFDDNRPVKLTGGAAAAPIWGEFMHCIEPYLESLDFLPPPGVTFVALDGETGQRATPNCPQESLVREVFVSGTEPLRLCQRHSRYGDEEAPATAPPPSERRPRRSLWEHIFG